jgi:poly(3-hydroxybutyrate) depolymerase
MTFNPILSCCGRRRALRVIACKKALLGVIAALLCLARAHAQTDVLIEIDRGRTEGVFKKSPVFQRAILAKPAKPADTALLYFRGYPGIARIQSVGDKARNLQPFMRMNQQLFAEEGIALVVMDCPTDQWGTSGGQRLTGCLDGYRSSKEHADDVRSVIAKLRDEHGFSRVFIMGHSIGTISSRWLAKNLGSEISGSIHSSSMNGMNKFGYANSLSGFPYGAIAAPVLHIHNENDACPHTPYSIVKGYAGENLVTVRGGVPEGDPCGGGHLHSHQGNEQAVVRSIISWIKTGKVDRLIGG